MRIVVDNGSHHLRNIGDVAMLQVCIARLRKLLPNAEFHVLTNAPELLERFCSGARAVSPVGRDNWSDAGVGLGLLKRRLPGAARRWVRDAEQWLKHTAPRLTTRWRQMRDATPRDRVPVTRAMAEFVELICSADLVVASGGGYVTDGFEPMAGYILGTLRLAAALGKPTAMFSQGIGPARSPTLRRTLGSSVRRATMVAVREARCGRDLLISAGVPGGTIHVTGDDAVEPALQSARESPGANIGFNVRNAGAGANGEPSTLLVAAAVTALARQRKTRISIVPISFHGRESDLPSSRWVLQQAGGESLIDAAEVASADIHSPAEVIRAASGCRLVVTGSYHAAVFALAQGIPAVCVAQSEYYQDKFAGLFDQFQTEPCLVNIHSPGWQDSLAPLLQRAWKEAERLRPALLAAAREQVTRGSAAYGMFARASRQRAAGRGQQAV